MKAGHRYVIQIFVSVDDMAADQCSQVLHGQPKFPGRLLLGVLRLDRFDGERSLIHECFSCILRGKQGFTQSGETLGFHYLLP